jgi:hypothetical protein
MKFFYFSEVRTFLDSDPGARRTNSFVSKIELDNFFSDSHIKFYNINFFVYKADTRYRLPTVAVSSDMMTACEHLI